MSILPMLTRLTLIEKTSYCATSSDCAASCPRFVLLEHDHPMLHWDLMLEVGAVLWTWRLDANPCLSPSCRAIRIADHRWLYLDYEGPVSADRGAVKRIADGEYNWVEDSPSRIVVHLRGENLSGRVSLAREPGVEWEVRLSPRV
jgi:DNA polymerase Ligase (LigD)